MRPQKSRLRKIGRAITTGALALAILALGAIIRFEIKIVQYEDAYHKYELALEESKRLSARHIAELKKILIIVLIGEMTQEEDARIQRHLSQIISAREVADAKLATAKTRFCALAGERDPLCQKQKKPLPPPRTHFI